ESRASSAKCAVRAMTRTRYHVVSSTAARLSNLAKLRAPWRVSLADECAERRPIARCRSAVAGRRRGAHCPVERAEAIGLTLERRTVRRHCIGRASQLEQQVTEELSRGGERSWRHGILLGGVFTRRRRAHHRNRAVGLLACRKNASAHRQLLN